MLTSSSGWLLEIFRNTLNTKCRSAQALKQIQHIHQGRTVRRYSTARSGLKKAARIAASICDLSKPMASILAMASTRCSPTASALASRPAGASSAGAARAAGVGVEGAAAAGAVACSGAAGGAGVTAGACAGVAGVAEEDSAGGAALGYI